MRRGWMTRIADKFHSALVPLIIVVAFVAIMVPTCQMVGCNGMMPMPYFGHGTAITPDCPGTLVSSSTPVGVVPSAADSLLLTLVSALVAVVVLFAPRQPVRLARAFAATPPPPPEDPRGERLRV